MYFIPENFKSNVTENPLKSVKYMQDRANLFSAIYLSVSEIKT